MESVLSVTHIQGATTASTAILAAHSVPVQRNTKEVNGYNHDTVGVDSEKQDYISVLSD